ncbi:MAG: ABC transporter ATP-binding protein [Bacteroidetes bacterium]|jgi:ABC-2 type transport system ATP-binding protein|nr:ABC transporter ATP-binding protein [Bacteroidota bacterium]MBT3751051.1 ABC transporter ATP-binding protein [Bacteroidota bacterium]MBT4400181.1 ABC transporter ATP-binding protein [Bacteroidota bacterium]MBT4410081.1 ABC transporter ATP-binding protein [Bacteroidota bacterium]MBT5426824.1 ABC transporter ATP-binding protein [Bacteroidota bacterium]
MEFLKATNIVKQFANHLALDKVDITVPEKSIFGLLGPNGAGKTTLIRIINQITAPDSGSILINGQALKSEDVHRIGYLPEERGLYKKMKVGEQALYLVQLKGIKKQDALRKLKYWFEKFEIQGWWDKKVEELSKGMAQKIQFITTILHEPQLLIFDEPFSGFDPINANLVKQEILNLRDKGATIIFSTHNMSSVEELCDHIALINVGKNILDGSIHDIRNKYKADTYQVIYRGDSTRLKDALHNRVSFSEEPVSGDETKVYLKKLNGSSTRELIEIMNPLVDIVSFNEVVPNMNDIFIRAVEETKTQDKAQ